MTIQTSVQLAIAQALGFDCDTVLSQATAQAFVNAGFKFVVRYLSLSSSPGAGDLTGLETDLILQSGLALMAVQHVNYAGWSPTQTSGLNYGNDAVSCATSADIPAGATIWLDLEGVNANASASDVISYCNAWFAQVSAAGYIPGIYVGANSILTGDQLYYDLNVSLYWRSGSTVPTVTTRGYCMIQTISNSYNIAGVSYDKDVIQTDNMGSTPFWVIGITTNS